MSQLGPARRLSASLAEHAARAAVDPHAVRLHTGPSAGAFTASVGAAAATVGDHIVLGPGVSPATHEGRRVIDHELVHVAQRSPKIARFGDPDTDVDVADTGGLDAEDIELWNDVLEFFLERADLEFIYDKIDYGDEAELEFWNELAEDPRARAYNYRAALILDLASISDAATLHECLESVEDWADSESETLTRIGGDWLDDAAWAFPDTWADRVQESLVPPSGLELGTAMSASADAYEALDAVAQRMPAYLWEHGLPVPYAAALGMSSFPFRASLAREAGGHVVYEFARAAARYLPTEVTLRMATGWAAGKNSLVADVRGGRKSIDPASWAEVSMPRVYQPDLSQLVDEALDHDIEIMATLGADVVDAWHYELALAKLAGSMQILFRMDAAAGISALFGSCLADADVLVAKASAEDRIDHADAWASELGYPAAARAALIASLKANAGQIAKDTAKDMAISMIPYVGWVWRAKLFVEEAADWYLAGEALVLARDRASSADSIVALQHASADICSAETGIAAQVVLEAAGKGAEIAVSTAVKAVKGTASETVDADLAAAHPAEVAPVAGEVAPMADSFDGPAPPAAAPHDPGLPTAAAAPGPAGSAPSAEAVAGVQQAIAEVEKAMAGGGTAPPRPAGLPAADADTDVRLLHGTDQSGLEGVGAVGVGKIDVARSGADQDLGTGFYMALDTATAEAYAAARVKKRKTGMSHVLEFRLPVSELGKVVDIRRGGPHRELWDAFLDKPPIELPPGFPVPEGLGSNRAFLSESAARRGTVFEAFLREIKQSDADTIIAPLGDDVFTGITAGKETAQVCIRSQKVADRLNAQIRGSE